MSSKDTSQSASSLLKGDQLRTASPSILLFLAAALTSRTDSEESRRNLAKLLVTPSSACSFVTPAEGKDTNPFIQAKGTEDVVKLVDVPVTTVVIVAVV